MTGLTTFNAVLPAKRLQLLREVVPARRVGVLSNPTAPAPPAQVERLTGAARSLGIDLMRVNAQSPGELAEAFAKMSQAGVRALLVETDAMFFSQRARIVDLAAKHQLPAVYGEREFADAGGLMAYATNLPANFRRAATYVDKILKGAKPGDLPIEQPTRIELVINLKDRQGARPHDPAVAAAARGRGDSVMDRSGLFAARGNNSRRGAIGHYCSQPRSGARCAARWRCIEVEYAKLRLASSTDTH